INKTDLPIDQRKEVEKELLQVTLYTQNLLLNLLYWAQNNLTNPSAITMEKVQILPAIAGTIYLYQNIASEKNVTFEQEIEDSAFIFGKAELLDIVIRNVLNNAVKFTPGGGKVILRAEQEGA